MKGNVIKRDGKVISADIEDISQNGLRLSLLGLSAASEIEAVRLYLPNGILDVTGKAVYERDGEYGRKILGFKFDKLLPESEKYLLSFLYVTVPKYIYENGRDIAKGFIEAGFEPGETLKEPPMPWEKKILFPPLPEKEQE
jgi:hypothetical protein